MKSRGVYAIEVTGAFTAAHQLRLPEGSLEPRHRHEWHVTIRFEAPRLDALGTVLDFHIVQKALANAVGGWNGRLLNEVEPFVEGTNPSAEHVAEEIARRLLDLASTLDARTRGVRLVEVRVTEAPGCLALWRQGSAT